MTRRPGAEVGNSRTWLGGTVAVGIVAGVLMMLLGMGPRLILVGFVVSIVSTAAWLCTDLGQAVGPVHWRGHRPQDDVSAPPDRRLQVLRARVRAQARRSRPTSAGPPDGTEPADEIPDTLMSLLDDHLVAEHGIDRTIDAEAAGAMLGPALTSFVTDPEARRSMTRRRNLARTITLVEAFTAPAAAARPDSDSELFRSRRPT